VKSVNCRWQIIRRSKIDRVSNPDRNKQNGLANDSQPI
jgi:hypothetical protein